MTFLQTQKEHYLNYRKVFHGETFDVFERRRKASEKSREVKRVPTSTGPTPFSGMSNAAAIAMASALTRTQPTQGGAPTIGLNSTGLPGGTLGQTTGLGTGTGLFGASTANTGFGTTGGLGTGLSTGMLLLRKRYALLSTG